MYEHAPSLARNPPHPAEGGVTAGHLKVVSGAVVRRRRRYGVASLAGRDLVRDCGLWHEQDLPTRFSHSEGKVHVLVEVEEVRVETADLIKDLSSNQGCRSGDAVDRELVAGNWTLA